MNFLSLNMNQIFAVSYVPHSINQISPIELPHLPHLISVERFLLLLLLIFLVRPLMREQKDPKMQKQRVHILRLSAIAGGLALVIHFYRIASGH